MDATADIISNLLFVDKPLLCAIISLPILTLTEPLLNTKEPLSTNPVERAGRDALSFVRETDKPSNIFTGLSLIASEKTLPNWSEPEIE